MNGVIELVRIRQKVRIGCTEQERAWPQILLINLAISLDHTKCVTTDALEDSVDYMGLLALVDDTCANHEWRLIETFTDDLAYAVLERFPIADKVKVSVTKSVTPVADGVVFTLEKSRNTIE